MQYGTCSTSDRLNIAKILIRNCFTVCVRLNLGHPLQVPPTYCSTSTRTKTKHFEHAPLCNLLLSILLIIRLNGMGAEAEAGRDDRVVRGDISSRKAPVAVVLDLVIGHRSSRRSIPTPSPRPCRWWRSGVTDDEVELAAWQTLLKQDHV